MGTKQEQNVNPKAESILAALAQLAWLFGPQGVSSLPSAQKGKFGGFMDQIAGGSAGNLPGTILPNFQNMLQQTSPQNSFFARAPGYTPTAPPMGIGGMSPLQTLFPSGGQR